MKFGIGQAITRREDDRLLTGRGRFVDDLSFADQLHAVFVRSPHAHARIVNIDVAAARAGSDVVAVLTGADLLADGVGSFALNPVLRSRDKPPSGESHSRLFCSPVRIVVQHA